MAEDRNRGSSINDVQKNCKGSPHWLTTGWGNILQKKRWRGEFSNILWTSYTKYPQARANKSPTDPAPLPVYLRFSFVPPSLLPSEEKANPDDGKATFNTLKVVACSISLEESEEQKREGHRNLQHFFDNTNTDMIKSHCLQCFRPC